MMRHNQDARLDKSKEKLNTQKALKKTINGFYESIKKKKSKCKKRKNNNKRSKNLNIITTRIESDILKAYR